MDFSQDDVELYDEYLTFIRRLIIDEYNLGLKNHYHLDLEVAEKIIDGMRFSFGNENGRWTYEAIDFERWLIMKVRSEKLNQLGI